MHCNSQSLFLSLVAVFFFPLVLFAHQPDGYSLTGRVKGLKEGDKVIMKMMVYNPEGALQVPKDTGVVTNGEFRIEGHIAEGPRVYWMWFVRLRKVCRMFIDNGQNIVVTYDEDISKVPHQLMDRFVKCDGSPTNNAFHLIWAIDDMYSQATAAINHELRDMKDSVGYDRKTVDALMIARKNIREGLNAGFLYNMEKEILPAAGLLGLYQSDNHDAIWSQVYDQMDEHLRNSVPGKMLQQRLPLLIGSKMPDFNLPDPTGKMIRLQDFTAKSKLTLVRFWATTSFNRAAFDEELRTVYKLYHDKGLNIIAVSTDISTAAWKNTLQTEQYPWQNVLDVRGETVVDTTYHELGTLGKQNTTNVLVDGDGRIVAWDVNDFDLRWALDRVLNPGDK